MGLLSSTAWILAIFPMLPSFGNFVCPGSGFFPDPSTCSAFYRCVDLTTSFQFVCPAGTLYDQELMMCNHKELVTCTLKDAGGEGGNSDIGQANGDGLSTVKPSLPGDESSSDSSGTSLDSSENSSTPSNSEFPLTSMDSPSSEQIVDVPSSSTDNPVQEKPMITSEPQPSTMNSTPPPRFEVRPTPGSTLNRTSTVASIESEVNIPDGDGNLIRPELSTIAPASTTTSTSSDPPYSVAPSSIYPCTKPGYFEEVSSCKEFYVCREIGPGLLSADKIFRCPDRYLFDTKTRLCQREHKVTCDVKPNLFYNTINYLVVQLTEADLDQFFKQKLTLTSPRGRTSLEQEISTNELRTTYELPLFYNIPAHPYFILYH